MKAQLSPKTCAFLRSFVHDAVAVNSHKPNARGQELIDAIPAEDMAHLPEELISTYLELESAGKK